MRVAAVLLLLAACQSPAVPRAADTPPTAPPSTPDVTPPAAAGPEVVVTAAAPQVRLGGSLRLTVTVRNPGPGPLTVPLTSGCLTDFEVLDANGQLIGTSEQMCAQVMGSRSIAAGASVADTFVWMPGRPGNAGSAPGTYRVRGVLLREGGPVRSAPITVQVLAAE